MTDIDDRRREIMRKLDARYYARWARINAETADERALRLGQPTSYDLRMRGDLRMCLDGHFRYGWPGDNDSDCVEYQYRQ